MSERDGIPWNPKHLIKEITGISWEQNDRLARLAWKDQLWGPENMVTFFLSVIGGVDIREVVRWNGSFDPDGLRHARAEYDEFGEKMRQNGWDRETFRDHVRGTDH